MCLTISMLEKIGALKRITGKMKGKMGEKYEKKRKEK